MRRFVIVGASYRCYSLFVQRLIDKYKNDTEITGVYDTNKTRCQFFRDKIGDKCKMYDDFEQMLDVEKPDDVIVTTTDNVHHEYIIRALNKGYNVICEKPITNTYEKCLAIRNAEKQTGKKTTVTFNCRYMPYFAQLKHLLMQNKIGKVLAINYDYCLDREHGGDYFKRWHRLMKNSQGMLLHKSTHHFDIINWLLEDIPAKVTALGNTVYYSQTERARGKRCSQCDYASKCESYIPPDSDQFGCPEVFEGMYLNAEKEDGYIRDLCSFSGDSDICDNMSVSVMYEKGALLTYSLNLFSEREGYRMVLTGENGVLIAENWSSESVKQDQIKILYPNGRVEDISVDRVAGTHGGGDDRMLAAILGEALEDELGQNASAFDGFSSAMIGIAANMSIKEGKTVNLKPYLDNLK